MGVERKLSRDLDGCLAGRELLCLCEQLDLELHQRVWNPQATHHTSLLGILLVLVSVSVPNRGHRIVEGPPRGGGGTVMARMQGWMTGLSRGTRGAWPSELSRGPSISTHGGGIAWLGGGKRLQKNVHKPG